MMTTKSLICFTPAALLVFAIVGCGTNSGSEGSSSGVDETAPPPSTVQTGNEHAHPSEGPHGGGLIELGNEEYHAELVHDDAAGTVTIYVLDSAGRTSVPIDATEVTINLTHDGQAEQFRIAASADTTDPAGKSSRFVSTDAELAEDLDHEGAGAQLVLMINGTQYRGVVQHDHDHDHDHDYGADH